MPHPPHPTRGLRRTGTRTHQPRPGEQPSGRHGRAACRARLPRRSATTRRTSPARHSASGRPPPTSRSWSRWPAGSRHPAGVQGPGRHRGGGAGSASGPSTARRHPRPTRALDVRFVIQPPASTALDKLRGLWDLVDIVTENNLIRAIVTWMSPMPFPFAETVALTDLQRAQLESLVRAGSTPQALVFRCRLILRAADRDHPTNLQIAAEFDCNRHTVAGWRNRYLSNGLAGLQDAP